MEVKFQLAKNNEETVSVNNCFLHSSYNPAKEAERFVDSINLTYTPESIVIIEPALSYCVPFLRKKFPDTKLIVIRICKDFSKYNSLFDFQIEYNNNFENTLLRTFSEEQLLKMYFINWKSSENVFASQINDISVILSKVLNQSKTQLITRQYFEKKWFLNSINYFKYIKKPVRLNGIINKPILIISSGPSLNNTIKTIIEHRQIFFIICLSSAISVCNFYNIIPDLYMSTDGGYWAGQHLKKLNKDIPLALPIEGYCNKSLLKSQKILPLRYKDSLLNSYINNSDIEFYIAQRNGTVTGTALTFALENSEYPVFLCGVDMANQKGYQHSQPNELELNNCNFDNRLKNKESRLTGSEFSSGSLDIYKNWFQNYNLGSHKVYRIIESDLKKNTLGDIEDISLIDFLNITKEIDVNKSQYSFTQQNFNFKANTLSSAFEEIIKSEEWKKQIFPLDMVSLSYNKNNSELLNKISERNDKIITKIRNIINE